MWVSGRTCERRGYEEQELQRPFRLAASCEDGGGLLRQELVYPSEVQTTTASGTGDSNAFCTDTPQA